LGMIYLNYFVPRALAGGAPTLAFIPNTFIPDKVGLNNLWLVPAFLSLFIFAIVGTYLLSIRNSSRYYKTLSYKERQEQFRQQLQQVVIDWIAWAVMVGLTAFLLNVFPSMLADSAVQVAGFALLCAWFIVV